MITALVLAGTRAGGDPLATAAGVSHKALIDIGGRPMIERVVGALRGSARIGRIVVAIERPELVAALGVDTIATGAGPSATVEAALAALGTPLVVTTADHALLEPAWVDAFLRACPSGADAVAALARRDAVEAAAPPSRRTWLRFADGDFSGCNIFLLATPAAARVVALWRTIEADRKRPLAMVRRLGVAHVLRYVTGRLTLAAAASRLGALAGGATVETVALADGRAAIDVDKADDLELVRRLVAGR